MWQRSFFDKCDKIDNTICIIEILQNTAFGGFTLLKWDKTMIDAFKTQNANIFVFLQVSERGVCAVENLKTDGKTEWRLNT